MSFSPGELWRYNNSGYILLGAIIEKVSGKSYADFVQERIFAPLGMADTRYDTHGCRDPPPGRRLREGGDGATPQYLSMTQPYAAGSLICTVDDLAKWDAGLDAGKVVYGGRSRNVHALPAASGLAVGYGFGRQIGAFDGHPTRNMAAASTASARTSCACPADGGTRRCCRTSRAQPRIPQSLARKAAAIAAGKPLVNPATVALTAEQTEAYVGRYLSPSGSRHVVSPRWGAAVRPDWRRQPH